MSPSPLRWTLLPLLMAGCPMPDAEDGVPANLTAMEVDCETVTPDATVEIVNLQFEPSDVSVPDKGVIQWINEGNQAHTVTSGNPFTDTAGELFDSGNLAPGDQYCLQLEGEGTAEYYCIIHPLLMQNATITVTPAEDDVIEPGEEPGEEPLEEPGQEPPEGPGEEPTG